MTTPRLVLRGLSKRYGERVALDSVDLAVPASSLVTVVGPNGSGKSTLLGCIAGVTRCSGAVALDGVAIRPSEGRVAYLPQRLRLPPAATVADFLTLMRALAGGREGRSPFPADFVPDGTRRLAELSGGQAQRVALAGVLAGDPDLVLLDEPFANLDDQSRAITESVLRALRDAGAVVLVTNPAAHDTQMLADLVVRMDGGRVVGPVASPERRAARDLFAVPEAAA